jgi:hypothetical protein
VEGKVGLGNRVWRKWHVQQNHGARGMRKGRDRCSAEGMEKSDMEMMEMSRVG